MIKGKELRWPIYLILRRYHLVFSEITMHIYCRSDHFRVFKFLRISDLGTFHEV